MCREWWWRGGRGGGSRDQLTLTKRYLETTTIEKLAIWVNTVWLAAGGGVSRVFLHGLAYTHGERSAPPVFVNSRARGSATGTRTCTRARALCTERPLPAADGGAAARERKKTQFTRWLNLTDSRKVERMPSALLTNRFSNRALEKRGTKKEE